MSLDAPGIGALRDRIQLFRKEQTQEDEGGHEIVFVPVATVWARVHARPAGLVNFADARGVKTSHSVTLRTRNDLSPGDRIGWRGRVLDVLSVEDMNGRGAFKYCACMERQVTA